MRSNTESECLNTFETSEIPLPWPPFRRQKLDRQPDGPATSDAAEPASQAKLVGLKEEHRDLDGAISALFDAGSSDQLLLARLKKRKLHLRDEIARIEG